MDSHLMQYEKECLRTTMLKHEETFKEQVCELHRLYQVQKLLMNDVKNKETRRQATSVYSTYAPNCSIQRKLSSNSSSYQAQHPFRMEKMIDLESPAEELETEDRKDVSAEREIEKETDIELTLSTGCSSNKKKKEQQPLHWNVGVHFSSVSTKTDASHSPAVGSRPRINSWDRLTGPSWESFRNEQKKSYTNEEISRQKGQPLWLFPVLSLNVT